MKKVLLFTALAAALTAGLAQAGEKLVVAATPVPHAEILELIKPTLAKEGVDLEVKVFTDYVQPNVQVARSTWMPTTSRPCRTSKASTKAKAPIW